MSLIARFFLSIHSSFKSFCDYFFFVPKENWTGQKRERVGQMHFTNIHYLMPLIVVNLKRFDANHSETECRFVRVYTRKFQVFSPLRNLGSIFFYKTIVHNNENSDTKTTRYQKAPNSTCKWKNHSNLKYRDTV